jgi:hypothetical protein
MGLWLTLALVWTVAIPIGVVAALLAVRLHAGKTAKAARGALVPDLLVRSARRAACQKPRRSSLRLRNSIR